ncbi:MAG: hypothetical protein JXA97_08875 [Anaerolineales bacterium]|nr:hypothetical protein [Anaerolineales bacterium]
MPAKKNASPSVTAEILAIGTELLLGEIIDTNTRAIARALREIGIDLFRTMTVGDNIVRIADALQDGFRRADVIITTGGLGPTIDDVTREGVARALEVDLEYHPELWLQIEERFRRFDRTPTQNNRRQAMLPEHAQAIENPIGTAPGFIIAHKEKTVIALPGVPAEMVYLLEKTVIPVLKQKTDSNAVILPRVLHLSGAGESWIDERIQDLEAWSNPTIGLAAHAGQVDIRITAKADTPDEAHVMLNDVERILRERLPGAIYGVDATTLEDVVLETLRQSGLQIKILEFGTAGCLSNLFMEHPALFSGVERLPDPLDDYAISARLSESLADGEATATLAAILEEHTDRFQLRLRLISPGGVKSCVHYYGGTRNTVSGWAFTHAMDFLRRSLSHDA